MLLVNKLFLAYPLNRFWLQCNASRLQFSKSHWLTIFWLKHFILLFQMFPFQVLKNLFITIHLLVSMEIFISSITFSGTDLIYELLMVITDTLLLLESAAVIYFFSLHLNCAQLQGTLVCSRDQSETPSVLWPQKPVPMWNKKTKELLLLWNT